MKPVLFICTALLLAVVEWGAALQQESLLVGYADVDITPPAGGSMPGYLTDRISTGMLDPLLAKVLVVSKGETTLVIVALDLVGLQAPEIQQIRQSIQQRTGIAPNRVFVHATHTHTGAMIPRRYTSDVEGIHAGLFPGTVNHEWVSKLPEKVASAVQTAVACRVREGKVMLGSSREDTIAFYRRFLMKDGTVRTNPGRGNPDIVRPAGEIDPTVHVLVFESTKVLLASYSLHPDCVGGTRYSADYPFHLTQSLRESLGKEWNVLYLNAVCGNINHIDVNNPDQLKGYEESRRIGRTLARSALAAREQAKSIAIERLDARATTVLTPLRTIPKEISDRAEREIKANEDPTKRSFNEFFAPGAYVLSRTKDRFHPAEILVFRLGPLALVGLPAEVFVEVGREIKVGSPFHPTFVIGLTGGSMGYVPHARGYEEGGYEAGYRSARYEPITPALWIKAAQGLLQELAR